MVCLPHTTIDSSNRHHYFFLLSLLQGSGRADVIVSPLAIGSHRSRRVLRAASHPDDLRDNDEHEDEGR
jgi:hypothetical protein